MTVAALRKNYVPVSEVINYITNLAQIWRKVGDEKIVLTAHGDG